MGPSVDAKYRNLLFITEPGRSGTTLLQRLLAGGENGPLFPESNAVSGLLRGCETARRLSPDRIQAYFGDLDQIDAFYVEAVEALLARLMRNQEPANYLVLKDPMMLDVAMATRRLFPRSHLIVNLRHPLDILASKMVVHRKQGRDTPLEDLVERTAQEFKQAAKILKNAEHDPHVHLCLYETLCTKHREVVDKLAKKLGFAAKYWQADRDHKDEIFATELSGQEISTAHIGTNLGMNPEQVALCKTLLAEPISSYAKLSRRSA